MDGMRPGCPDDITLEAYICEDLSFVSKTRVRVHLMLCRTCQDRLLDLQRFHKALSEIPVEELPPGFLEQVVASMEEWGDPTPAAAEKAEELSIRPSIKVRWAVGILMFVVSTIIQWQFGEYLPHYLSSNYVSGLKGLTQVWEYMRSGAWWQSTLQVIEAVRTDGLGALGILGASIPTQIAGVVVFGGIVTAVLLSQLRASRGRREGRHR